MLSNEIISNTLKYAFTEIEGDNVITFKLNKTKNNQFTLLIGDNGKGSTIHLNSENTGFGMDLITILTSQVNGTIKQLPVKGTMYEILFSA